MTEPEATPTQPEYSNSLYRLLFHESDAPEDTSTDATPEDTSTDATPESDAPEDTSADDISEDTSTDDTPEDTPVYSELAAEQ